MPDILPEALTEDLISFIDKTKLVNNKMPWKQKEFLAFVQEQYKSPSNDKLVLLELILETQSKKPATQAILNRINEILTFRKQYSFSLCATDDERNIVAQNIGFAIKKAKKLAKKPERTADEEMWVSQIPYLKQQRSALAEYNQQLEMHSLNNKDLKRLHQKFNEILSESDSDSDLDISADDMQATSMRSSIASEVLEWRKRLKNDGSVEQKAKLKQELQALTSVVLPNQNLIDQEITKLKIQYLTDQLAKKATQKADNSSQERVNAVSHEKLISKYEEELEHLQEILAMIHDPDPNARIGEAADPKIELLDIIKLIQTTKDQQEKQDNLEIFGIKMKEYLEDVRESKIANLEKQVKKLQKALQELKAKNESDSKPVLFGYEKKNEKVHILPEHERAPEPEPKKRKL